MQRRYTAILLVLAGLLLEPHVVEGQPDTNGISADELEALLPNLTPAQREELASTGELARLFDRNESDGVMSPGLAPAFSTVIGDDLAAIEPKIGVEVLFIEPSPLGSDEVDTKLYNVLQSISTMEGIEYYSASRERYRTLFHESYVVNGPDDRARVPDPVVSIVPEEETLYIYQRDSSFGRNTLELTYQSTSDAILLRMRNLTRMFYQGIIPALGPDSLHLYLVVYLHGDTMIFYGASGADPPSLFGMEERVQRSFYNRLVALHDWFLDQTAE